MQNGLSQKNSLHAIWIERSRSNENSNNISDDKWFLIHQLRTKLLFHLPVECLLLSLCSFVELLGPKRETSFQKQSSLLSNLQNRCYEQFFLSLTTERLNFAVLTITSECGRLCGNSIREVDVSFYWQENTSSVDMNACFVLKIL